MGSCYQSGTFKTYAIIGRIFLKVKRIRIIESNFLKLTSMTKNYLSNIFKTHKKCDAICFMIKYKNKN